MRGLKMLLRCGMQGNLGFVERKMMLIIRRVPRGTDCIACWFMWVWVFTAAVVSFFFFGCLFSIVK
jgi:hypothetical protein